MTQQAKPQPPSRGLTATSKKDNAGDSGGLRRENTSGAELPRTSTQRQDARNFARATATKSKGCPIAPGIKSSAGNANRAVRPSNSSVLTYGDAAKRSPVRANAAIHQPNATFLRTTFAPRFVSSAPKPVPIMPRPVNPIQPKAASAQPQTSLTQPKSLSASVPAADPKRTPLSARASASAVREPIVASNKSSLAASVSSAMPKSCTQATVSAGVMSTCARKRTRTRFSSGSDGEAGTNVPIYSSSSIAALCSSSSPLADAKLQAGSAAKRARTKFAVQPEGKATSNTGSSASANPMPSGTASARGTRLRAALQTQSSSGPASVPSSTSAGTLSPSAMKLRVALQRAGDAALKNVSPPRLNQSSFSAAAASQKPGGTPNTPRKLRFAEHLVEIFPNTECEGTTGTAAASREQLHGSASAKSGEGADAHKLDAVAHAGVNRNSTRASLEQSPEQLLRIAEVIRARLQKMNARAIAQATATVHKNGGTHNTKRASLPPQHVLATPQSSASASKSQVRGKGKEGKNSTAESKLPMAAAPKAAQPPSSGSVSTRVAAAVSTKDVANGREKKSVDSIGDVQPASNTAAMAKASSPNGQSADTETQLQLNKKIASTSSNAPSSMPGSKASDKVKKIEKSVIQKSFKMRPIGKDQPGISGTSKPMPSSSIPKEAGNKAVTETKSMLTLSASAATLPTTQLTRSASPVASSTASITIANALRERKKTSNKASAKSIPSAPAKPRCVQYDRRSETKSMSMPRCVVNEPENSNRSSKATRVSPGRHTGDNANYKNISTRRMENGRGHTDPENEPANKNPLLPQPNSERAIRFQAMIGKVPPRKTPTSANASPISGEAQVKPTVKRGPGGALPGKPAASGNTSAVKRIIATNSASTQQGPEVFPAGKNVVGGKNGHSASQMGGSSGSRPLGKAESPVGNGRRTNAKRLPPSSATLARIVAQKRERKLSKARSSAVATAPVRSSSEKRAPTIKEIAAVLSAPPPSLPPSSLRRPPPSSLPSPSSSVLLSKPMQSQSSAAGPGNSPAKADCARTSAERAGSSKTPESQNEVYPNDNPHISFALKPLPQKKSPKVARSHPSCLQTSASSSGFSKQAPPSSATQAEGNLASVIISDPISNASNVIGHGSVAPAPSSRSELPSSIVSADTAVRNLPPSDKSPVVTDCRTSLDPVTPSIPKASLPLIVASSPDTHRDLERNAEGPVQVVKDVTKASAHLDKQAAGNSATTPIGSDSRDRSAEKPPLPAVASSLPRSPVGTGPFDSQPTAFAVSFENSAISWFNSPGQSAHSDDVRPDASSSTQYPLQPTLHDEKSIPIPDKPLNSFASDMETSVIQDVGNALNSLASKSASRKNGDIIQVRCANMSLSILGAKRNNQFPAGPTGSATPLHSNRPPATPDSQSHASAPISKRLFDASPGEDAVTNQGGDSGSARSLFTPPRLHKSFPPRRLSASLLCSFGKLTSGVNVKPTPIRPRRWSLSAMPSTQPQIGFSITPGARKRSYSQMTETPIASISIQPSSKGNNPLTFKDNVLSFSREGTLTSKRRRVSNNNVDAANAEEEEPLRQWPRGRRRSSRRSIPTRVVAEAQASAAEASKSQHRRKPSKKSAVSGASPKSACKSRRSQEVGGDLASGSTLGRGSADVEEEAVLDSSDRVPLERDEDDFIGVNQCRSGVHVENMEVSHDASQHSQTYMVKPGQCNAPEAPRELFNCLCDYELDQEPPSASPVTAIDCGEFMQSRDLWKWRLYVHQLMCENAKKQDKSLRRQKDLADFGAQPFSVLFEAHQ